jgi:hypothetical protein
VGQAGDSPKGKDGLRRWGEEITQDRSWSPGAADQSLVAHAGSRRSTALSTLAAGPTCRYVLSHHIGASYCRQPCHLWTGFRRLAEMTASVDRRAGDAHAWLQRSSSRLVAPGVQLGGPTRSAEKKRPPRNLDRGGRLKEEWIAPGRTLSADSQDITDKTQSSEISPWVRRRLGSPADQGRARAAG